MALVFVLLFTACSGATKTPTDPDAVLDGTTVGNSDDNGEEQVNPGSTHGVFGKFESVTLDGEAIDYTAFEGKITMVNIWATFCGPCISEMPDLERINKEYGGENFQIVGIVCDVYMYGDGNYDEFYMGEAKSIVEDTGVSYINILPSVSLNNAKLGNVQYIPETVFLDEEGNQIGESFVGSRSYEDWCEIIDSVLES